MIAAGTDQAESEQRWLSMSGPAVKTLEALQAHNAGLPPPTEARDTGLRLRVLSFNIHNFRGYPEDLGTARWKSHPEDKLDIQLRTLGMLDAHLASLQECAYDKPLQLRLIDRLGYRASFFPASHHTHCAGATLESIPAAGQPESDLPGDGRPGGREAVSGPFSGSPAGGTGDPDLRRALRSGPRRRDGPHRGGLPPGTAP